MLSSCAHTCLRLHAHACICMSKQPCMCMWKNSLIHSHMPRGPKQAAVTMLFLHSALQKQNDAMCSTHAWQGHECCLQLLHPNSGLTPCPYLAPSIVRVVIMHQNMQQQHWRLYLDKAPLAGTIAGQICYCRQKMPYPVRGRRLLTCPAHT